MEIQFYCLSKRFTCIVFLKRFAYMIHVFYKLGINESFTISLPS